MKTNYVMQDNSLEDYLENHNSERTDSHPSDGPCFNAHGCKINKKGCEEICGGVAAPIDANIGFFLLIGAVIGIMFLVKKKIL